MFMFDMLSALFITSVQHVASSHSYSIRLWCAGSWLFDTRIPDEQLPNSISWRMVQHDNGAVPSSTSNWCGRSYIQLLAVVWDAMSPNTSTLCDERPSREVVYFFNKSKQVFHLSDNSKW